MGGRPGKGSWPRALPLPLPLFLVLVICANEAYVCVGHTTISLAPSPEVNGNMLRGSIAFVRPAGCLLATSFTPANSLFAFTGAGSTSVKPPRTAGVARSQLVRRMSMSGGGEDLEKLTVVQLKERLKSLGLTVGGRKAELIQRLQDAGSSATATPATTPAATPAVSKETASSTRSISSPGRGGGVVEIEACKS